MIQILAEHINQLDLALDQLALRDPNFDRFALMLVDNVVELAFHTYAQDRARDNKGWQEASEPRHDPKIVASAQGQFFENKIKLAKVAGLISSEIADTIQYLHGFRNTVYHSGMKHEGILHALALFYFDTACSILEAYKPMYWSSSSRDQIPHRAIKYLGETPISSPEQIFRRAWSRLREVAHAMGDTLVNDLHHDMLEAVESTDSYLHFLVDESPNQTDRPQVILDCQAWPLAFSDEGKAFAAKNRCQEKTIGEYVSWLASNYPFRTKSDPISSWRSRAKSLAEERNKHLALKKYCDFMKQTQDFRDKVDQAAALLDAHIEELSDRARGK